MIKSKMLVQIKNEIALHMTKNKHINYKPQFNISISAHGAVCWTLF